MLLRLELLGRHRLDEQGCGLDSDMVWNFCIAPFVQQPKEQVVDFLVALKALLAKDRSGFAALGAYALAWDLCDFEHLGDPAPSALIDAGIDVKLARGIPEWQLSAYEVDRLAQRQAASATRK